MSQQSLVRSVLYRTLELLLLVHFIFQGRIFVISDSGSQKSPSPNFLYILSTKSTISQKMEI